MFGWVLSRCGCLCLRWCGWWIWWVIRGCILRFRLLRLLCFLWFSVWLMMWFRYMVGLVLFRIFCFFSCGWLFVCFGLLMDLMRCIVCFLFVVSLFVIFDFYLVSFLEFVVWKGFRCINFGEFVKKGGGLEVLLEVVYCG